MPARYDDARGIAETERAIRVDIDGEEFWIPKKAVHEDSEVWHLGHEGTLVICDWFMDKMSPDERSRLDRSTRDDRFRPIQVTNEQRLVIEQAIALVRNLASDRGLHGLTEGRCLELLCADYLAGKPDASGAEHWKKACAELWAAIDDALGEGTAVMVLTEWRGNAKGGS